MIDPICTYCGQEAQDGTRVISGRLTCYECSDPCCSRCGYLLSVHAEAMIPTRTDLRACAAFQAALDRPLDYGKIQRRYR